ITELPALVALHLSLLAAITLLLNAVSIAYLRVWNPSQEIFSTQIRENLQTIWSGETEGSPGRESSAETARHDHVDSVLRRSGPTTSREVWTNPVLWREVCTWAYGRKILAIRVAYLILFLLAAISLSWLKNDHSAVAAAEEGRTVIQATARPLIPLFFVSFVIINALAVTSITNERDGKSLDLLLVTDLSPREFVWGKLGGIFWVTKEMVLLPMLLCVYMYADDALELGNLMYVVMGLAVMYCFVAMLGMHCGMHYGNSRTAIGVSLGTVFFLFLGVVTCILLMISFSGSFQIQLFPFLAFIAGGSIGLYASLGARNPSSAIAAASLLLPLATFYAITSFLMGFTLGVFLVVAATYGFATAAMMVPALSDYDFASTRTSQEE
ncbi:MAG: ABC transporter permease, partial [Planctomycetota bacterium]|nr:ABC transporter permease [Planctomycetota bacterium]